MTNSVEELLAILNSPAPHVMRRHVKELDNVDDRFSSVALRLLVGSQSGPAERLVRIMLDKWLRRSNEFEQAVSRVEYRKSHFGDHYNVARVVLDDAIAAYSVATMVMPKGYDAYAMVRAATSGDYHLVTTKTIARPDMMEASDMELKDYYRPIAVAGKLLKINTDETRFIEEAPAFLTWTASQSNIDDILAAALRAKSLELEAIEDMAGLRSTTHSSLHGGLI